MAWIESHQSLLNHRKTLRVARVLDLKPVYVMGHLHAMWHWCLDNAPEGFVAEDDLLTLAVAAQWEGNPRIFVDALMGATFLEPVAGGIHVHDWDDYAGKLIDRRRHNADQMRAARARNAAQTVKERVQHVVDTSTRRDEMCRPTGPNPTGPDMTGPEIVSSAEETAPSGAASLRSALDQAKHDLEQPKANKAGIVGRIFENVYGRRPAFGFLAALIRDYDAPYELCCLMVEILPDWNGCDDPQKFLAGVISTRKDKRRANGRSPPSNPYLTAEQLAEKARLDQEQLAEFVAQDQAKWKH